MPVPVVFISDDVASEKHSIVNSDNFRSGYQAAKHFAEYGYTSLYFCGFSKKIDNPRAQGFFNYMKTHGIPFDETHNMYFDIENPYRNHYVISTIMKDTAERIGVFCFHDLIALYLYNLCVIKGISVPDKVGLIGYDKLDTMIPANIKLTTFSYSFENIANSASELLISNIDTLVAQQKTIVEDTILYIGETTAKR